VPSSMPDDERPRLAVGGRTYVIEGRLARGESSNVYRGRWVRRLGELVVLKVLRSLRDADLLHREFRILEVLRASDAQGPSTSSVACRNRSPWAPVVTRPTRGKWPSTAGKVVICTPWRRFAGSIPTGSKGGRCLAIQATTGVAWLCHRSGFVHGAVIPPHVLVHPRDHGAVLVGWSMATERSAGDLLPAISRNWKPFYLDEVLTTRAVNPATDVAMAARCVLAAAGAKSFDRASMLPGKLARLLVDSARGLYDDAWSLIDGLAQVSLNCYGPPSYHPIPMPGWRIASN